ATATIRAGHDRQQCAAAPQPGPCREIEAAAGCGADGCYGSRSESHQSIDRRPVSAGHVSRSGHTTGAGKLWHELKRRHAAAYARATRGNADREQGSRAGAQLSFLFEHRLQPFATAATPTRRTTSTTGTTWARSKRSPKHFKRSAPKAQKPY